MGTGSYPILNLLLDGVSYPAAVQPAATSIADGQYLA